MEISALASGSSGNCFYIENKNKAILVDAGISRRQIANRLKSIGKSVKSLKGVFITHEHSDHIKGLDVLTKNYKIPIFTTKEVAKNYLSQHQDLIEVIKDGSKINIAGMEVEAFKKHHDALNPLSFNIVNDKKISIMTDIGHCCKNVRKNVLDSDFLCMESNHDLAMLEEGPYPQFLKNRIMSDEGHLSNRDAALCVLEHAKSDLQHVILAHISKNNNSPERVLKAFKLLKERKDLNPKITLSYRNKPTKVFTVS